EPTAAELGSRAVAKSKPPKYRRSVDRMAVFGRCHRRRFVFRGVPAHTTDLRWPPPLRSQAQIQANGQGDGGNAGPVVVCSVNYEPIAGHRANIPLVKYLSEGREMEIALAPIAGTLHRRLAEEHESQNMVDAIRQIGVSELTYYRWRQEFGGLKTEQVKRLKDLELENSRLRKAVSDLTLDKLILQEAARGNF